MFPNAQKAKETYCRGQISTRKKAGPEAAKGRLAQAYKRLTESLERGDIRPEELKGITVKNVKKRKIQWGQRDWRDWRY